MRLGFCLCLLAAGCFGGSQNPSYFPYYLPTGDIIRTHAKPGGIGFFRNFDPKACCIELTPANVNAPTRGQVVLIATVLDKDGDARRKRRVEWQIEGPGTIVEVDESGWLPGRGYQVTEKYAVSYTDMLEHTITRGNDDPRDDFTVAPGQTWCVISSAVPGETVVTAYAPAVYDWEKRRAFARIIWGDGGFLPMPVSSGRETDSTLRERAEASMDGLVLDARLPKAVPVNRETTAYITLANGSPAASSGATVRAVIPDGAELMRSDPPATRRNGNDLYWNFDSVPAGQRREIAIVLKPTRNGPFKLAAAANTADGLTASTSADSVADTAGLNVRVEVPAFAAAGEAAEVNVIVSNPGNVPVENAVAWLTPGEGLAPSGGTVPVELRVGSIPPGQSRTVATPLRAQGTGKHNVRVDVTADSGISARGEGTITVGRAELMVHIVGPEQLPLGDTATYEVQVSNAGDASIADVDVRANLPRGMNVTSALDGRAAGDSATWTLATLAPGEQRIFRLAANAKDMSELASITATAGGSLTGGGKLPTARTSVPVAVRGTPVLTLELQAPAGEIAIGGRTAYRVIVRNRGNAPARDVVVNTDLSGELTARRAGGGKASVTDRRVSFESVPELPPGGTLTLTIEADAKAAGSARVAATVNSKDLPGPLREEQATRITTAR